MIDAIESGIHANKEVVRLNWPSFEPYAQFMSYLKPDQIVLIDDIDRLPWSTIEKVNFLELIRTNGQGIRAIVSSELAPEYKPKATFGEEVEEPVTENVELYDVVTFSDTEVSTLIDRELGERSEAVKDCVLTYQDVLIGFRRREWAVLIKAIRESNTTPGSIDDLLMLMDDYYAHHTMERVKTMSAHAQKVLMGVLFATATREATNVKDIANAVGTSQPSTASELGRQLSEKSGFVTQAPITTLYRGEESDQRLDLRQRAYRAQDPLFALWVTRRSFRDKQQKT